MSSFALPLFSVGSSESKGAVGSSSVGVSNSSASGNLCPRNGLPDSASCFKVYQLYPCSSWYSTIACPFLKFSSSVLQSNRKAYPLLFFGWFAWMVMTRRLVFPYSRNSVGRYGRSSVERTLVLASSLVALLVLAVMFRTKLSLMSPPRSGDDLEL